MLTQWLLNKPDKYQWLYFQPVITRYAIVLGLLIEMPILAAYTVVLEFLLYIVLRAKREPGDDEIETRWIARLVERRDV